MAEPMWECHMGLYAAAEVMVPEKSTFVMERLSGGLRPLGAAWNEVARSMARSCEREVQGIEQALSAADNSLHSSSDSLHSDGFASGCGEFCEYALLTEISYRNCSGLRGCS